MRAPDYFDRYDADEQDGDDHLVCRRCGATGLYWQKVAQSNGREDKAVLFSSKNKRRHVCDIPDDFEVVKT